VVLPVLDDATLIPRRFAHACHGGGGSRLDRLDDVVVAGAAADVAFELVADGLLIESLAPWRLIMSTAAMIMPGVQKPHCRP
jgi:hypothetical protein